MSNNVSKLLHDGRFTNYCSISNKKNPGDFAKFIESKLRDGCHDAKTFFDQLNSPEKYNHFFSNKKNKEDLNPLEKKEDLNPLEKLGEEYVAFKKAGLNG